MGAKLTIDIGFETVKTTSDNNLTSFNEFSGFEGVIGSSKDDIIIGGNNENKVGAAGEDLISGDNDDFVDYEENRHCSSMGFSSRYWDSLIFSRA